MKNTIIEVEGIKLVLGFDKENGCVDIISGEVRNVLNNISGSVDGVIAGNVGAVFGDITRGVGGDIGDDVDGTINGNVGDVGGTVTGDVGGNIGGCVGGSVMIDVMKDVKGKVHGTVGTPVTPLPKVIDDGVYVGDSLRDVIIIDAASEEYEALLEWKRFQNKLRWEEKIKQGAKEKREKLTKEELIKNSKAKLFTPVF